MMNDTQLNALLGKYGIEKSMPDLTDGGKKAHPHLDAGIYAAKEELKGVDYESNQNKLTAAIQNFMEQRVTKHLDSLSEWENNIATECEQLIRYCLREGYIVREQLNALDGFNAASTAALDRDLGKEFRESAALLVLDYKRAMGACSEPINQWVTEAQFRLDDAKFNFDYDKKSSTWIVKRAIKEGLFSTDERHDYAKALHKKDNMIAEYSAKANMFAVGQSDYKNALMFAFLYCSNLKQQRARELKKMQENQNNPDYQYQYTGFDSITSLFPIGAKEMLAWAKDGEFKVFKQDGVRTAAYFELGRDVSVAEKALLTQLTGRTMTFTDGKLDGTHYNISTEERLEDGKAVMPNKSNLVAAGFTPDAIDALLEKPFNRGARAWFGDKQQGDVVFVEVFKQSFKLWMVDFKNIG